MFLYTKFVIFLLVINLSAFAQPNADFTANITEGCVPILVQYNDLSTGSPASWFWDFGNGNTSTKQNPEAIYINPGIYTVTLVATNAAGGDTIVKTSYIDMYAPAEADFSVNTPVGCMPLTVNFTDLSVDTNNPIVNWYWDFGDGANSTSQNPSHTYTSPGKYTVYLIVIDTNRCQDFFYRTDYVEVRNPIASFNAASVICIDSANVAFSNISTGVNLNYSWDFGDGDSSSMPDPSHLYLAVDTYTVNLVVSDDIGCTDTATQNINVIDFQSDFTFSVDCDSIAYPFTKITFTDLTFPYATGWLWDFGDGNTSIQQNPVHIYSVKTTYTITLIANAGPNCSVTTTKIYEPVIPNFDIDTASSCISPLIADFTNLSTGTDSLSYFWDLGDGTTSTDTNVTHTFTWAGSDSGKSYIVNLNVTDTFGCISTFSGIVHIGNPIAGFEASNTEGCAPLIIQYTDTSYSFDSIVSWNWDFGDGYTGTGNPISHFYQSYGVFTVSLIVTDNKGCTDTITKIDYLQLGSKPDYIDFTFAPVSLCWPAPPSPDTTCFHNMYQFFGTAGFNDTTYQVNNWYWDFRTFPYYGVLMYVDTTRIQDPYFDTGHIPLGYDTIMFVAGYNGCNDTIYKAIWNAPPVSSICHVRVDSVPISIYDWAACEPPLTLGFYQCSYQHDSVLAFTYTNLQTGLVTNLDPSDTTYITFTSAGEYQFFIATKNDTTKSGGCGDCNQNWKVVIDSVIHGISVSPGSSCLSGNQFTFNDTTVSFYGKIRNWYWDFADGNVSYDQNPTHSYDFPGTYIVTSVKTVGVPFLCCGSGRADTLDCFYTDYDTIIVNGTNIDFSTDSMVGCPGLATSFTDSSTSTSVINQWYWNFGDGSPIDTNQNPSHTYNSEGSYLVTLKIVDSLGCTDSLTKSNFINITSPASSFNADKTQICLGDTINFLNTSSGINLSYVWYFGDGDMSTNINPKHVYTGVGSFTVSLLVIDNNNCTDSLFLNNYITVIDTPIANFTTDTLSIACPPLIVNFLNNSTGTSLQYLWDFGDSSSSTLEDPWKIYPLSGNYNVTFLVTDILGCQSIYQLPQSILVSGPYGTYDFMPDTNCVPNTVNFVANTVNSALYIWDFGDGNVLVISNSDGGDSVSHTYTQPGIFTPFLFIKNASGCPYIIPYPKIVVTLEQVVFDFLINDSVFCMLDSVSFTGLFADSLIDNYLWEFGDGDTSTLTNPVHYYDTAGTFYVTLNVNTTKCQAETSKIITVNPLPIIDVGDDINICLSVDTVLNANGLDSYTYAWTPMNGLNDTTIASPIASPGSTTTYFVTIYDSNACENIDSITVIVNSIPVVDAGKDTVIKLGESVNLIAIGGAYETIDWEPVSGLSCTDCLAPTATPTQTTTYYVKVTDTNGCAKVDSIVIVVEDKSRVLVPSAFSPNDDGINDQVFVRDIIGEGTGIASLDFNIYNRWGEKVFEAHSVDEGWDGKKNGKTQDVGVYTWLLKGELINGEKFTQSGNVTLIR
ncbi:PKD domain-containing protein [Candidatus Amoebophilus asiaticus]|nr:PKD domain-containing protein [Candidatus Amoebophilus asiaticus]